MTGLELLARNILRYALFEPVFIRQGNQSSHLHNALANALKRLYGTVLLYLIEAKKYFEMNSASMLDI